MGMPHHSSKEYRGMFSLGGVAPGQMPSSLLSGSNAPKLEKPPVLQQSVPADTMPGSVLKSSALSHLETES